MPVSALRAKSSVTPKRRMSLIEAPCLRSSWHCCFLHNRSAKQVAHYREFGTQHGLSPFPNGNKSTTFHILKQ